MNSRRGNIRRRPLTTGLLGLAMFTPILCKFNPFPYTFIISINLLETLIARRVRSKSCKIRPNSWCDLLDFGDGFCPPRDWVNVGMGF